MPLRPALGFCAAAPFLVRIQKDELVMRCSSTVVCLVLAILVSGLAGCHSTGAWNSPDWTTSSFNPVTWRMGVKVPPSSLAADPPAKPSLAAAPTYPNTSDTKSLASGTTPPKIEYSATAAGFNAPASALSGSAGATSPLMAPQQGRYGATNPLASNPVGGFNNPVYTNPASSPPLQNSPVVQTPYRASAPAIPQANGSLATAASQPYATQDNVAQSNGYADSRYQASIASSDSRASALQYRNDPNSRYYEGSEATAANAAGSADWPKVISGNQSTASAPPAAGSNYDPAAGYPGVPSPVNVTAPANSGFPANNYPVTSPVTATPPSAVNNQSENTGYQPGADQYAPGNTGYTPGDNGYTPGDNGYQIPATRSSLPVQSGSQSTGSGFGYSAPSGQTPEMAPLAPNAGSAPPFRPGSTGSVPDYPWNSSSSTSSSTTDVYPNPQYATPVKTSINTSNVMPVGFNQDSLPLRR